jgi:nucleotide-binding universal stress UspA family protein
VWAFRPAPAGGAHRIVAAVDAAAADEKHMQLNREIIEVAAAIGRKLPHVVYVWSVYGEKLIKDYMKRNEFEELVADGQRQARADMEELLAPFQLSVDAPEVHLLRGSEGEEITRFINAGSFEALVIGTVGRTGISGFLVGNTAEVLIDRVNCSLIAVKPPQFVSPLTP